MKIALAQYKSLAGELESNIKGHEEYIRMAYREQAEAIFFPELSLTGYDLYTDLSIGFSSTDPVLDRFKEVSKELGMVLGIGLPIRKEADLMISMLVFFPDGSIHQYDKELLDADEEPYYKAGNSSPIINIGERTIGLGICYETLHEKHYADRSDRGAEVFLVSVANYASGIERAYPFYAEMAGKFSKDLLMVNAIGSCGDFEACGRSAVWNKRGELVAAAGEEEPKILYCTI